jgi:uncharacterized protein (DUF2141 family)
MRSKGYILPATLLLALVLLHFSRCANVIQPTGGPRDTIPPALVEAIPQNQSINYTGQSFYFEFDEKIKTDKLKDQLIITPRTEAEFDIKYSKRGIELTFDEPFQENTTYTFNFREGISDITEGNPTEDNKFVFSTGPNIDSLEVKGFVTVLLTQDTLNTVTVGLYDVNDTINIFNGSPYYFTETDEEGAFLMENLKNGKYKIYAFNDGNKNLELETNNEQYAFLEDTLQLEADTAGLHLRMIALDLRQLKLLSALPSGHYFDFNYNKYLTDYQFEVLETRETLRTGFAKDHQAVRFYNTFSQPDSIPVLVVAYDSINTPARDTAYVKFQESSRKKEALTLHVDPGKQAAVNEKFDLHIALNKPVKEVNTDSIFIQYDTTRIFSLSSDTIIQWNFNRNKLTIPVEILKAEADTILARRERREREVADSLQDTQETDATEKPQMKRQMGKDSEPSATKINRGLQLVLGKSAFITYDKDSSARETFSWSFINPEEFGTISGTIQTSYNNYIVQLLNAQNEIIRQSTEPSKYIFRNVPPGNYRIRVLIDADGDGSWSSGNMLRNIEPEPVFFFGEVISIRANWELNQQLVF